MLSTVNRIEDITKRRVSRVSDQIWDGRSKLEHKYQRDREMRGYYTSHQL